MKHFTFRAGAAGSLFVAVGVVMMTMDNSEAGGKKKYIDPTPRKEQILKRFVREFVRVTPGKGKFPASFRMGSKIGPAAEQPVHEVAIGYPFSICKYEATQELYHVVMGKNPSKWQGLRNSVEITNWDDADRFCKKVTALLRKRKLIDAGMEIRLPTEAEWEYACRAGTKSAWSFGNKLKDLTDYAWYKDNSKGYDPPVGAKKPNAWGLYDMHGYIWEWCADDWAANYQGAAPNGAARRITGSKKKVIRGGSWAHTSDQCRSSFRDWRSIDYVSDKVGFRCVLGRAK